MKASVSTQQITVQEENWEEHKRTWHVNIQLSVRDELLLLPREEYHGFHPQLNKRGDQLVQRLFNCRWVNAIEITKTSIAVHKGPAFNWEKVGPKTSQLISAAVAQANKVSVRDIRIVQIDGAT